MRWMDRHPAYYICLVGAIIAIALWLAIKPLLRDQAEEKPGYDWGWGLLIVAILAAGRWPSIFFPREINPDETQMVAGANALLHDPVFWRSVDGGTAGPLDFFALWPAGWIFGPQTYLAARFTAFALLAIALVLAHQCLALLVGRKLARIAGLAAVCLEALTNAVDMLHYSTEVLPMTLLTAAVYAAIQRWELRGGPLWSGLGGLLLGAVWLAKLQAVPLAAGMGLAWLLAEIFSKDSEAKRRILYLLVGAILPMVPFAIQLTIAGEWKNAIVPYWLGNFQYAEVSTTPIWEVITPVLRQSVQSDSLLHLWLPGSMIWFGFMLRIRGLAGQSDRIFLLACFVGYLLSLFCVFYPARPYLHYWQLVIIPVTLLLGATMGNLLNLAPDGWRKSDRFLVAACGCLLVGTLFVHRALVPNYFIESRTYFNQNPRTKLVAIIRPHVRPGDSIAIWGWAHYVYVEAGVRQATRDANFSRSVELGPYREFYRERFLADLVNAMPTFFLDSVGPCNLAYNQPGSTHDQNFPDLAAVVYAHYILIDEILGARLYLRRDLANR